MVASTLATFRTGGKIHAGDQRLFKILVTESAFLIWRIRNQRVCAEIPQENWPKRSEIENHWHFVMNRRLQLDITLTHRKWGRKALKKKLVIKMWDRTLQDEHMLPDDWTNSSGVLVGRARRERRRVGPQATP